MIIKNIRTVRPFFLPGVNPRDFSCNCVKPHDFTF